MLESLGYAEVPEREEADLILFNTCSIREKADERFVSHLYEARALKRRDPERVIGVGGCWAQSVKDQVFRAVPVRRRGVRARPGAQAGRVPDQRFADGAGLLRVRGLHRPPAGQARARRPRLGADQRRLQHEVLVLHRARRRAGARSRARSRSSWPRCAQLAADGVREVTLLGQNVNSYGLRLRPQPRQVLRAAARGRRDRGHRPRPLHEPAPARTCARTSSAPTPSSSRSASTSTCRCRRAPSRVLKAMRRTYDRAALPGPRRADPRARARTAR